jgi:hypothetical protein
VVVALQQHGAVYLAATGGAGALLSRCIKEARVVAYEDLGPEAVWRFVRFGIFSGLGTKRSLTWENRTSIGIMQEDLRAG